MRKAIVALVLCLAASTGFAAPVVSLTGAIGADFDAVPSVQQAIEAFQSNQPLWGFGWEVIPRRIGVGGTYMVDFFRDSQLRWFVDWSTEPLYLSFHVFGGRSFLDPFLQAGLGCTGRTPVDRTSMGMGMPDLYLSLFPFVAAGLSLNLEGFVLGAKLRYAPFSTSVPVTDIPPYPMGSFQVTVFTGISL